jgi:hypothetical protein
MTDDTEDMRLVSLIIQGVTHCFAVDGQAFVFFGIGFIPTLQGPV